MMTRFTIGPEQQAFYRHLKQMEHEHPGCYPSGAAERYLTIIANPSPPVTTSSSGKIDDWVIASLRCEARMTLGQIKSSIQKQQCQRCSSANLSNSVRRLKNKGKLNREGTARKHLYSLDTKHLTAKGQ